jgi:hypothetical protein
MLHDFSFITRWTFNPDKPEKSIDQSFSDNIFFAQTASLF